MQSPSRSRSSVLVVDDEVPLRSLLRTGFELEGFDVRDAPNAAEAIRATALEPTDLVILDLGLPDLDGGEILRQLRTWSAVPIIVLSARSSEEEKVRLLELGADDYVVKPFGMAELLARARAALRRRSRGLNADPVVRSGPLQIDLATRTVLLDGKRLALTRKEYQLLQILAQHAGNVVSHPVLLGEIWGPSHVQDSHYLRVLVRSLRQKIELDPIQPRILLTELGVGYRLAQSDVADAENGSGPDRRASARSGVNDPFG
jgi:two-component system, OmpR family, KDP operon response regulator KdpE